MAEVFKAVGSEKVTRIIARHARVQARLEAEAKAIKRDAQQELESYRRKTDYSQLSPAKRAEAWRNKTRVYYAKGKIDHHVGLSKAGEDAFFIENRNRHGRGGLSILRRAAGRR